MQKLLLLIFMLATFVHANEGPTGVKAVVSNKTVTAGNIVELHIRATGKIAVFPTIKKISGVKVLSQDERITHMHTYSHGELQKECTILTLTFAPKKDMTIPSYKVEIDGRVYETEPIKLKVKNIDSVNADGSQVFSLKLKSHTKSVTLGESFTATVILSLQQGLVISKKLQYSRPAFKGFIVETVDKGKSYTVGNHQITELRYILTPHSEGNFTLGPAHAKIALQDKSEKNIFKIGFARKWFQKASNTLEVEVYPRSQKSDLTGSFTLTANINTQKVPAGQPVTLKIKLEGEGNLVDFDFPNYSLDGVTIYSNRAKTDVKVVGGKIHSSYAKEFVFISEKNFVIPERLFTMYNAKEGVLKELNIKALPITVTNPNTANRPAKTFEPREDREKLLEKIAKNIPKNIWMFVLAFVLGGIFVYAWRYLPKYKQNDEAEAEALTILYGHISKDPEVEEMVRKLYARKNGDASIKINKKRLKELVAHFR